MSEIHDKVKDFLKNFLDSFSKRETRKLSIFYESNFKSMSDEFFTTQPWPKFNKLTKILSPSSKKSSSAVESQKYLKVFKLFYKELRFRHIYTKHFKKLSMSIRTLSFLNYQEIFKTIFNDSTLQFDLPRQWIWDMVDEFIYQFQEYHMNRVKNTKINIDDVSLIEAAKKGETIWSLIQILETLENNVHASGIVDIQKSGVLETPIVHHNDLMRRALGNLSQIGLLLVNCMIGDYYNGLKAVSLINMSKSGIFTQIFSCNVKFYYYTALACFMQKRFVNCIKIVSSLLLHTIKYKKDSAAYQYGSLDKKIDSCLGLLAISLNICPYKVDDSVYGMLKDKFGEKLIRLMKGDISYYEEVFSRHSTPKYYLPRIQNVHKDLFIDSISHQIRFVKNFGPCMKSFKEIKLENIKDFYSEMEGEPLSYLFSLKHKGQQLVSEKEQSILCGKELLFLESEYYVDDDLVVFAPPKFKNDVEILLRKIERAKSVEDN